MIEIISFACSLCGEQFKNKEKCRYHERRECTHYNDVAEMERNEYLPCDLRVCGYCQHSQKNVHDDGSLDFYRCLMNETVKVGFNDSCNRFRHNGTFDEEPFKSRIKNFRDKLYQKIRELA